MEFPVANLVFSEVKIWPLLRLIILNRLTSNEIDFHSGKGENYSARKLYNYFLKPAFVDYREINKLTDVLNYETSNIYADKDTDVLYFMKPGERTEVVNQKMFSRFGNSLGYFSEGNDLNFKIIEYSDGIFSPDRKHGSSIYIDADFKKAKFKFYLNLIKGKIFRRKERHIENWAPFITYLTEIQLDFGYSETAIIERVVEILQLKNVFRKCIKLYNPSLIFLTCFYSDYAFALTLAAQEHGIKVVELQHGQQGDFHMMYSHWENYPIEGYDLIPDIFWMWSRANLPRIEQWTKHCKKHRVIVGGNPWLGYSIQHSNVAVLPEQFLRKIKTFNKVVLLSLQHSKIPKILIDAIDREENILWLIRLHPRFIHERNVIETELSKLSNQNYELAVANQMSIYNLFDVVDVQVTFWSTVAYESLAFDVPTIIVHENGQDAMSSYIEKGIFRYSENTKEIIDLVNNSHVVFKKEEERYIEFDKELIQSKLTSLLGKTEN